MSITIPIYGPNDKTELDLIFRLCGLEPPAIHTHTQELETEELYLPSTGNRIQNILGRANSHALNQAPVRNLLSLSA